MADQDVLVVGIDLGTSVVKSVAFDAEGHVAGMARQANAFEIPSPGYAQCSMEETWTLVRETLQELTHAIPNAAERIRAVGISGNMGGAWLTDEGGTPIRPAILWNDGRAVDFLAKWQSEGILQEIFEISCNALNPGFTVPVLCWLKEHEPKTLQRAKRHFFSKDWIRWKLTGEHLTEESDASHVPGDVYKRGFSERVFSLCGLSGLETLFPQVVASCSVTGEVTRAAANQTGLKMGTPVIAGLADVSASLTGAGAIKAGMAVSVVGTSCLNSVVTDSPVLEPCGVGLSFLLPGGLLTRTFPNQTGTIGLDWFVREIMLADVDNGLWDFDKIEALAASVPQGARGIIFHPYLNSTGVLAPVYAPRARGRFWGLSLSHTREDMLRAVYEGLALAMADCFEHMPAFDGSVRLVGGAAKSPLWQQMFADATGHPMTLLETEELGALGVAMLAGSAIGLWPDLETAVKTCVHTSKTIEPDTIGHAAFGRTLQMYQHLRRDLVEEYESGFANK